MMMFDERSWRSWGWSGVGLIVIGLVVDAQVHDAQPGPENPLTMLFAHAPAYVGLALTVVGGLYGRSSDTPEATLVLFAAVVQGLAVSADMVIALGGWDGGGLAASCYSSGSCLRSRCCL